MAPRFDGIPVSTGKPRFAGEPVQPEKPQAFDPITGSARSIVEGIPILGPLYTGAVDQVTSGITGMITGEDPAAIRERVYARQDAFEQEQPIVDAVARIAGGTAAMAPLGATQIGARLLGIAPGMSLAGRAGMGAASGGTISAADTAVRGGDAQDALVSGVVGAGLGGAAGAAAPYIARGLERVGQAVGLGGPRLPAQELSGPARQALTRVLAADGTLGQQGALNIANAGPRAMLADAGPNAAALLDTAIQRSGPGSRIALDAVEARASAANDDVTRALDAALGQPQGVATTQAGIRSGSAPARQAAYDAAYSSPIDYAGEGGRNIEAMLQRVPQGVIGLANRMMALEGQQSAQIMAQVADDGTVTFMRMPDVRQLDYITRALNQAARSGEGQGALGGQTDIGRLYGNLARDIRDTVRTAVPAYDEALRTAATPIQAREALIFGEGLLSPQVPRDEAQDVIEAMTGPQLEAARQGVRSYIDELLANVRAVASDPNLDAREAKTALQQLSSRAVREKVRMLIGDEAVTNELFYNLSQASRALELRANVSQNSRTFARMAMDQSVADQFDNGLMNTLLQGRGVNAVQAAVQGVTGRTPQGIQGLRDTVFAEIAQALTTSPDRAIDLLSGLASLNARPPRPASFLPGAVAPTAGVLSQMAGF